jgi:DNA-binding response OmpR family regulator
VRPRIDALPGVAAQELIAADGLVADRVQREDAAGNVLAGARFDLVILDLMCPACLLFLSCVVRRQAAVCQPSSP